VARFDAEARRDIALLADRQRRRSKMQVGQSLTHAAVQLGRQHVLAAAWANHHRPMICSDQPSPVFQP
jgi:hypothetical protein